MTYRNSDLPDAMTFLDGRKVRTEQDWMERKAEIKDLWCEYFIGHYPQEVPALLDAETVRSEQSEDGSTRKRVVLTFGTPNKRSFEIELWAPPTPERGARPLLLIQPRTGHRERWGQEALQRGYVVCVYPGLDAFGHKEDNYPGYEKVAGIFQNEYPDATWDSSLGVQAWLASRTLDYLLDSGCEYEIDHDAVAITGFSRYGKQAIYAAAFDERIKCVVARSSGTPTACAYRFAGRHTFMESVSTQDCPEQWLNETARTFYGRENELPVEGNALLACIAPRHLLIDTAHNDGSDPTFGVERSYLNAKQAWTFLGAGRNICLSYRTGDHTPITDDHVKRNLDFVDMAFGRASRETSDFPEVLLHAFDWNSWRERQNSQDLESPKDLSIPERIQWMFGEAPQSTAHLNEYHIKQGDELGVSDSSRDRWNPGGITRVPFGFSGKMHGNIYFDPERDAHKGTVVWLHPWNYSHGSNAGYGQQGSTVYFRLAQEGYIVAMYDQLGFGDHLIDGVGFYDSHPHWSRMGRMVADVSRVIDFLIDRKGIAASPIPESDPSRIILCGFALGGMVGLYAAALDDRISGLACFSGFSPLRTDTDAKPTGGIRQYWEWHSLLPKLGLYHGKEATLPYDYDDLLRMISPRHCLVYAPTRDRFTDSGDIASCVAGVQRLGVRNLTFLAPDDICRFQNDQRDVLVRWLAECFG